MIHPQDMTQSHNNSLSELIETVHRLRAPGGCPWDRAQTHQSLRPYLIEEAYEVLDVLDQIHSIEDLKKEKIRSSFREELGDLLMQVVLHSEMTQEAGAFGIQDVAKALNDKLIRRHPHVFGNNKADSADGALQRWEKEKAKEKGSQPDASILDGVPKNLPALQRSARVIEKVTKVGFQWKDLQGPLAKVEEELNELKAELIALEKLQEKDPSREAAKARVESELGDLFFSLCNVAHFFKMSPEDSLRKTTGRFEKRFRHVEQRLKGLGKTPEQSDLNEMDQFWDEAKSLEKVEIWGLTGGIASGKSTVGQFFAEFGIPVIDADQISRDLTQKDGPAQQAILKRFGTADRNELKNLIFSDPQAKQDLEAILHPLIRMESFDRMMELSKKHPVIVYEAALLVETQRYKDLNGLIVVESNKEDRINRLLERDKIALTLAHQIVDAQISEEERKQHANEIIHNTGTKEELRTQIQEFIHRKRWI